ncbi:peptide/nickel transport system ATP-binding protein [Variovorax sp. YR266]|uniref:ATP-binding cassette domain-containing protein n=1 Tax=Variovorax sp. YR266 TaxID=1884386 RepID=UPI000896006F|nr:ABC transporter ATP-binding protein [Variovorax sp. YR266]SDY33613.1 peptide/nickel transport system ATP-binding protein [Variovorax sp. YR266]
MSPVLDRFPLELLRVRDLRVDFAGRRGTFSAVKGVSFDVHAGRTLCLLGESGSGKSVTLKSVMRLLPNNLECISGSIRFEGAEVLDMGASALRDLRGAKISMVFQEPMSAFDPVCTVGHTVLQVIRRHTGSSHSEAQRRALELFDMVRIPSAKRRLEAYPHELSGGLRQRVMIALALSCKPSLLLADEPTTALDTTVQIQILLLLRELQQELRMGMIFVTHDLGAAAEIADDVAVMLKGEIVEANDAVSLLTAPSHEYTTELIRSSRLDEPRYAAEAAAPVQTAQLK